MKPPAFKASYFFTIFLIFGHKHVKAGRVFMKLVWLFIVGLFGSGYVCTYLLSRHQRKPFLPAAGRKSIRRFGITCFFVAVTLCLLVLYIRLKR